MCGIRATPHNLLYRSEGAYGGEKIVISTFVYRNMLKVFSLGFKGL